MSDKEMTKHSGIQTNFSQVIPYLLTGGLTSRSFLLKKILKLVISSFLKRQKQFSDAEYKRSCKCKDSRRRGS